MAATASYNLKSHRLTGAGNVQVGQQFTESFSDVVYTAAKVRKDGFVTSTCGKRFHPIVLTVVA